MDIPRRRVVVMPEAGRASKWLKNALWWFAGLLTGISGYCVVQWLMEGGKPVR